MGENVILNKTYDFAVRIVQLSQKLVTEKKDFIAKLSINL